MVKKIVTTARGVKLDMDFLRKSQPKVKPVVAVKKEKIKASKAQTIKVVKARKQRLLNAETPAPRPIGTPSEVSVVDQVQPTEIKEHTRVRKTKDNN